MTKAHKIKYN